MKLNMRFVTNRCRARLYLARQPNGSRVPAEVIAEALAAPRNYLSKTLGLLAKAGVITAPGARTAGSGWRFLRGADTGAGGGPFNEHERLAGVSDG
jgi:DNA-binding IscR family transcriptional regulator